MALGVAVPACGVASTLGIYGVRKYLVKAKAAEARMALAALGTGIARCSSTTGPDGRRHGLPRTSRLVPDSLSGVGGHKYMSTARDWTDEAFSCASFALTEPQYFAYQWKRVSPTHGVGLATADLDGDGAPDVSFELPVDCDPAGPCVVGALVEDQGRRR